jgi:hypothetical protein
MYNERIGEILDCVDYMTLVNMGCQDVADGEPNHATPDSDSDGAADEPREVA